MSDRESVLAANRAFYDAFESLDAEKMEAVWLRDPRIICIHPGWRKLSGWGPIMSSWERILDNVFEMKFELGEIEVTISGDLAIVRRGKPDPARLRRHRTLERARHQRVRARGQRVVHGDASWVAGARTARRRAAAPVIRNRPATVRGENSTMLKRVDRIQIAVADSNAAERVVAEVFGAELVRRDKAAPLGARRTTMQAGASLVEILEPDGAGAVQDFVSKWQTGLFGAGFSVDDPGAAAHHLAKCGVGFEQSAGQLYLDAAATFGMRTVISQHQERASVGAIKWFYEVTNVVGDWQAASARYARIFGLDATKFSPIESKDFGYTGTLTLFDPPARLDRVEITQITDASLAMGRFHKRRGDSLYMFYVETDDVGALEQRLQARGARFAANRRDEAGLAGLFIHPSAFLGVLVGVSRTDHAWLWSGDPERARRAATDRARKP